MKALVYEGPKLVKVKEVEEPSQKHGQVLIDIKYCGVCGSDRGIFLGTHPRAKAPLILGHEFVGKVLHDGEKFKKGDRVVAFPLLSCGKCLACRTGNSHVCKTLGLIGIDQDGGMCEKISVDEDVLFKVPEKLSDKAAALIEPLAVLLRAIHQSNFQLYDTVVVTGAGPIGLLAGIVLKHAGAKKVIISDVVENRLNRARKLGFIAINSQTENLRKVVMEATDEEGCDLLFECSGSPQVAMEMTDLTRIGGGIVMVAVHKHPHEINLQGLNFKEQWIIGTRVYTKEEFGQAVSLAEKLEKELEKVVSHIIALSDAEKVFNLIDDPNEGTAKVIIDCTQ